MARRKKTDEDPRLAVATRVMTSMTGAVDSYEVWRDAQAARFTSAVEMDEETTATRSKRARRQPSDRAQVLAFIDWMFEQGIHEPWCPSCGSSGNEG